MNRKDVHIMLKIVMKFEDLNKPDERFEDFLDNKLDVILDGFILGECSIMKLAVIHLIETKQVQLNKLNNFESRKFAQTK
mgnify:CR=1 FL=1